jgi:flagellin-like protein
VNKQKGEASVGSVVVVLLIIIVAGALYFAHYVKQDSIKKPFSSEDKAPRSETEIKSVSEIEFAAPKP